MMNATRTGCKTAYILHLVRIFFIKTPAYLQNTQKLIYCVSWALCTSQQIS